MFFAVLLCFVFLFLLPLLLGAFFQHFIGKNSFALGASYLLGLFSMMALMQVLAVPFVLTSQNFNPPFWLWLVLVCSFGITSLFLNRNFFQQQIGSFKKNFRKFSPIWILVLFLVLSQVVFVTVFSYTDWDDSFYVATSVTTWQTNTMYQFNPYYGDAYAALPTRYALSTFSIFCAALARAVGLHPTILIHSVLPLFLTFAAYIVYALIGDLLFQQNKEKIGWFLVFVCVLNLFGNTTVYTSSSFLLLRIWQGKAILGAVLIPLLFWVLVKLVKEPPKLTNWAALFMLVLCACAVSSMGVMLAPLFLGCFSLVFSIAQKKPGILLKVGICLIPCFFYGILYVILR